MIPYKYHAAKLSWLKNELNKIPKIRVGKDQVYIYDDSGKKHRYRSSSQNAMKIMPLIRRRKELENEYNELLFQWERTYRMPPPEIGMPIPCDTKLDYGFFEKAKAGMNTYPMTSYTEYNGIRFRSKNEEIAAYVLDVLGLPYKYETAVVTKQNEVVCPDFLVGVREINRCFYYEVCGKTEDGQYLDRKLSDKKKLIMDGYRMGRDVHFIYAPDSHSFDIDQMKHQILSAIEGLIPGQ